MIGLFVVSTSCKKETEVTSPVERSSSVSSSQMSGEHFIGEHFGGGIIFYLDKSGKHGLIASTADPEEPAVWSRRDTLNRAADTALFAGDANSRKIIRTQGFPNYDEDGYAALSCMGLIQNGYQDWYLASKNELEQLYKQRKVVGNFNPFSYWSSSEVDATTAWMINFGNGSRIIQVKIASNALRPIRKF